MITDEELEMAELSLEMDKYMTAYCQLMEPIWRFENSGLKAIADNVLKRNLV